jgi:prostaglandin-E synthase 1
MTNWLANPAFLAYAATCVVLCLNLLFLWGYSGAVRGKSKTALNAEDAATYSARLVDNDPPEVARVLRAHANAQASIYPFLFLGLVFVLAGAGANAAALVFGIFTVARLLHTFAYLKGLQPWRTIFFLVGAACIVATMVGIVWLALR